MSDANKLKERVKYFLNSPKYERSEVKKFINDLKPLGNIAIFGGMLRDLSLNKNNVFFSDVDLVIDSKENEDVLLKFLKNYETQKNSFGGHRIFLSRWKIDLWRLESTWAFRENLIDGKDLDDLVKTTFFTWDAIVYKVNNSSVFHIENYFELLNSGILDINFEPNKNPLGIVTRALLIALKNSAKLSPNLVSYVLKHTQGISAFELFDLINENHLKNSITAENIKQILNKLKHHSSISPDLPFQVINEQLKLAI